jgi:uncharacterized membrane protein
VNRQVARRRGHRGKPPPIAAPIATAPASRIPALDSLRGLAILAMVAYHFCFDLRYFGVTQWDFYHDPLWLNARTLILSSFLLIAGVSLVLADRGTASLARFWRHVAIIGACAIAVSVASYALFPASWIWFGVLHAIAVSLVLARPLVRRPALALILGIVVIAAGNLFTHPPFDSRARLAGLHDRQAAHGRLRAAVSLVGVLLLGITAGHALVARNSGPLRSPKGGRAGSPGWAATVSRPTWFTSPC